MSRRWHYTPGCHLPSILADGLITTASGHIDPGERPAVWFSEQTHWEPTVQLRFGLAATIKRFGCVARFEVAPEVCPVSWREFKRTSGVSSRTARKLEKSGRAVGGYPELWWVSYEAVTRERWLSVEVLDAPDGMWCAISPAERDGREVRFVRQRGSQLCASESLSDGGPGACSPGEGCVGREFMQPACVAIAVEPSVALPGAGSSSSLAS